MASARTRGFSLVELVVVCAGVALVCVVAAPGMTQARRSAGLAGSLANLKRSGEAGGNYAADFDDQVWGFTWSTDEHPTDYPDLLNPGSNAEAVTNQAIDIIRRLSDYDQVPRVQGYFAPTFLSTLVLADYQQDHLPVEWMVSPGDAIRRIAQDNPDDPPDFSGSGQGGRAWDVIFGSFGSSYALMPAFWSPDEKVDSKSTISQAVHHRGFLVPSSVSFGKRRAAEILFPSSKAQVADRESFYFGPRPAYYLHSSARVPVLTADGAVASRTSALSNRSFRPNWPDDEEASSLFDYTPDPVFETPALSGTGKDEDLDGKYKWTRRGLRGIDFAGERAE